MLASNVLTGLRGFMYVFLKRIRFPYCCCWSNTSDFNMENIGRNCFFRFLLNGGLRKMDDLSPKYQLHS